MKRELWTLLLAGWFLLAASGGAAFLVSIIALGGSPVPPEVFGPWVYAIPAWSWAAMQIASGLLAVLGVWVRSPLVFGLGGGLLTLDMAFLAAAGLLAGPAGSVLSLNALAWIGPYSLIATYIGIRLMGEDDE